MPQYCDSETLERNWFQWILSSKVPTLEKFRELGLLWTKVIGISRDKLGEPIVRKGEVLRDPSDPHRLHCIAFATPIYFDSLNGSCSVSIEEYLTIANLTSDSPFHQHDNPLVQQLEVIPELKASGYILEIPTRNSWHLVLSDINKICAGIAMKFKPRNEDERQELVNDAIVQVMQKLVTYKLVYRPGLAPVFNLLTTTIHRILYSIMNKRRDQREGINKILAEAEAGVLPNTNRSLRVHTHRASIRTH